MTVEKISSSRWFIRYSKWREMEAKEPQVKIALRTTVEEENSPDDRSDGCRHWRLGWLAEHEKGLGQGSALWSWPYAHR